ncbi:FRIGIDA-like protein 3 [Nymphaea colorata]|uniref:FRIGIDA-like protein 3 n=1 Tax=Nymphaea colorata TaxID=210225 RepID=UPI00129D8BD0|nr:FRIGIDA-like protein 3 [Nymphaea colorata]XP_031480662.1 FRIGIDA-like protein 3 [Nymphaea colorata]XP_031480663.1 FRIGIDA-like protein 3 [Nymphaea colorata]XP_031480665.1 FRIGIDA-like protein 3 [Nymphaea colorata]XP_031480666.1 FRIGIDA-like protein 3 [Nymphaea colorata]
MADSEPVLFSRIESTSSLIEQLHKAFGDLETHRGASLSCKLQWEELQEHFSTIESSLKKRFDELEKKEKEFEAKAAETHESLKQREVAVAAKEQASLDRLQVLKGSAVAEIEEACSKYKKAPSPKTADTSANSECKVSSYSNGEPNAPLSGMEENLPDSPSRSAPAEAAEVKPRPQLKQLCEEMDAIGLLNFISENRKVLSAIREEVPVALKSATNPAQLVLDSLEGFYPPGQTTSPGDKRDGALLGLRRSCILLLESLAPLSTGTTPDADHPVITPGIKQQAKAIADEWKPTLADVDADAANGNSLEVQAFLQLLATFNISSDFDEDELCKLVLAVSRRKQTPELCHALGLAHKMPGVIESLTNSGRQIDAVNFIYAFKLTESFPPVPLLKTYLKDVRRASQGKGGNAGPGAAQNYGNAKELAALRAIMKCIEEHKLETEYPLDPLQKRVAQLDKAKADKKRMGETAKPQPKRSRANPGSHGHWMGMTGSTRVADVAERGAYNNHGPDNRYIYPSATGYNYQVQAGYNAINQGRYDQQRSHGRPYLYPESLVASPAAPYSATTTGYGGVYMGSGLQSSHVPPTYL